MKLLREYVRHLLSEISELPKDFFTKIDDAIMSSGFWQKPNYYDDLDVGEGPEASLQTPAAAALESALRNVFVELGLDMDVFVSSHETEDPDYMLQSDHPAYPNRWLIDAKWYVSSQKPGRNTIDLEIMIFDDDMTVDEVNPAALTRHVAQTVRHELVHYTQMRKQALNKGLKDDAAAFEEMKKDPSQIPDENDPKYWEKYEPTGELDEEGNEIINKDGFKNDLYQKDYLRSHIEIDAHAHDAAEDLLAVYGEKGAFEELRSGFDTSDPELPNAIQHYHKFLPEKDPTIKKLNSKIYSYLQSFLK